MRSKALVLKNFTDIDWNHFEKSLHNQFGVNAVTLHTNGTRRTSGKVAWANSLCALIKSSSNGAEKICDRMLKILIQAVKSQKGFAMDECAAGMNKIVFPIIENDEISGFINICGRPYSNADRIYTGYIGETIGAEAEQIKKRLHTLFPIGPRALKEMKQFVTSYAH